MPYYLALPTASTSSLEITCKDKGPHLTHEVRTRAAAILNWTERELQTICPPHVAVRCAAALKNSGYLTIWAEASHKQFQPSVDGVANIAMRSSNGCCECCDNPGELHLGERWLTTLCKDCFEKEMTDSASIRQVRGEEYDIAA